MIGPGILVAATGVGAGDLATGAFAGTKLGLAVLWAVPFGAALKYLVTEGLARWQLATGTTLLEGSVAHLGRAVSWLFLVYLLIWSFFVGSALMSACGVAAHAILPVFEAENDKVYYGLLHSGAAVGLVVLGGYRLLSKVMSACVGVMFVVVVTTALVTAFALDAPAAGGMSPDGVGTPVDSIGWTIALIGGVGGTLTVLSYGYWIREEGRRAEGDVRTCRIDLATAYTVTAIFGMSMVVIGSRMGRIEGGGATLVVDLADSLESELGRFGVAARWLFLVGAWGAVFSSLLGVWQGVPYLFADFWQIVRRGSGAAAELRVDVRSMAYRLYLVALATVPAIGLWWTFERMQKLYAVVGAMFVPMLALALLILNGRSAYVGGRLRNSVVTSVLLAGCCVFFAIAGWQKVSGVFSN
jgi:Mn2+/Fe2+ NRAMP family transporter